MYRNENLKGALSDFFSTSIRSQNIKKLKGPFGNFLPKKSHNAKKAGNGPSQCHIEGSKIGKDSKVSSILFYSTRMREIFLIRFFWSPVSRIVPKNVEGGPLGVFEHPFFCKIEKNEGGTL